MLLVLGIHVVFENCGIWSRIATFGALLRGEVLYNVGHLTLKSKKGISCRLEFYTYLLVLFSQEIQEVVSTVFRDWHLMVVIHVLKKRCSPLETFVTTFTFIWR